VGWHRLTDVPMLCEAKCGEGYESFKSSNNSALSVVEARGMHRLIVANCLVSMQQSLPSVMASLLGSAVSTSSGRNDHV
jgi:hypothetical protein